MNAALLETVGFEVSGAGRPVLLVHGSMSHKGQWRALAKELQHSHKVVAIDLYGYGDSVFPVLGGFSMADEIGLAVEVIERVFGRGERFHIVGHSYGGAVALNLAKAMPNRVRSVALFEPAAFNLLDRDSAAYSEITAVARTIEIALANGRDISATARFVDYWSGPGTFAQLSREKQQALVNRIAKIPLDFAAIFGDASTPADYEALPMPVCLLAGSASRRPTHGVIDTLARSLFNAQLTWVDGGHMTPVTDPHLVNPVIAGFIHQVDAVGVALHFESEPALPALAVA